MSNDPKLHALFAQAQETFDQDEFGHRVMSRIDRERRRSVLAWGGLFVVAMAILAFLAPPAIAAAAMAAKLLPASLIEIETDFMRPLLAPINSVAAAIAIGFLGIRTFFRWILR